MQATTTPLDLAIQKAGGNAALARMLKVHRSAVTHWRRIGIPAAQAVRVSALTGIPIADLRPDLAHAPEHDASPLTVSRHEVVKDHSNAG